MLQARAYCSSAFLQTLTNTLMFIAQLVLHHIRSKHLLKNPAYRLRGHHTRLLGSMTVYAFCFSTVDTSITLYISQVKQYIRYILVVPQRIELCPNGYEPFAITALA